MRRPSSSLSLLLTALTATLPLTSARNLYARRDTRPLPLSVQDGLILDAKNNSVGLVGVNWPGHLEPMIPEGLQYQSVEHIVSSIADAGFNSVRLTFATEMVDDVVERGGDVTLKATLERALGPENGTRVMRQIAKNNPAFNETTKRLEVWDAVATEMARQNVLVHLDNHVSRAGWCCGFDDGNGWFGDESFNTSNWVRGLSFMAEHGKANWKSFSSVGLRNEIREPSYNSTGLEPRTWDQWKTRMIQAANAVHSANPDVLIFFGGRTGDLDISAPVFGRVDNTVSPEPGFNFSIGELPFRNKFVFEQHVYNYIVAGDNCASTEEILVSEGIGAGDVSGPGTNRAPLVMSEWGHDQTDGSGEFESFYRSCLMSIMVKREINWMVWTIGGSYYIREGVADRDETFGILDHEWKAPRGEKAFKQLQEDMRATYKALNQTMPGGKESGGASVVVPGRLAASVLACVFVSSSLFVF